MITRNILSLGLLLVVGVTAVVVHNRSSGRGPRTKGKMVKVLVKACVVALWLVTGVPATTCSMQSAVSRTSGHPERQSGSVAGVQFWIVGNEEFLMMEGHFRYISIFVEPQELTVDNARAIFSHFSERYPAEDGFLVEVVTNDRQVGEAEAWFSGVLRFPFGNVLPARCGTLPQERVSAKFHRSELSESFHCYSCLGSGGQVINEYLRSPSAYCEVRGEGPADLLEAAQRGCEEAVEWLLDHDLDPNVKSPYGGVPLVEAALWGKADIVKLLLERGPA